MRTTPGVSIEHLQSRLLRLIDEVRHRGTEPAALRAEVLLAINRLCSAELLVSLWQTLEKVGAREELLLVRLLVDAEALVIESACRQLLSAAEPQHRAVGLAVTALRGERSDARRMGEFLSMQSSAGAQHSTELTSSLLERAAQAELAPYSFVTCMLAALRDFHAPLFANMLPGLLRRYADGQAELELIESLLDDSRPELAQIGFVALASRFMGRLQRFVYEDVVCGYRRSLTRTETTWMQRALSLCPEVLEAVAELVPIGMASPDFMRSRMALLAQFAEEQSTSFVEELATGQRRLRSLSIEAALSKTADVPEHHVAHGRSLAYLYSLLLGHRPGLMALMSGLERERELETVIMAKTLELSGDSGAINAACALVGHWHELDASDPDQGPFRRWIESLWRDDRHRHLDQGLAAALGCPDETSIYAAQVLASMGDALGAVLRSLMQGQLVDLAALSSLPTQAPATLAIRALLRSTELKPHPGTIVNLARAGMVEVQASLRAFERHPDAALRQATQLALLLFQGERVLRSHPLFRQLCEVGLKPVDRECFEGAVAEERVARNPAALSALKRTTGQRLLMDVHFWFASASLPTIVGSRPASGYAARAEFVVDLQSQRVQYAAWFDRTGREHVNTRLPSAPKELCDSFRGIPWDTPIESMGDAVKRLGGVLLSSARFGGASPASRLMVAFGESVLRLETDELGRFHRAIVPLEASTLDVAVRQLEGTWGAPTFRTDSTAVWRFDQLEMGVRPDPAFNKLAQYFTKVRGSRG